MQWQDSVAWESMGLESGMLAHLARQLERSEPAGDRDRLVAIGDDGVWERVLAVLSDKRRVDAVPLRLQNPSEDGMACFVCDTFEVIQGSDRPQGSTVWGGQIEGSKFHHLVRGR